jgi:hypothetical protein
MMSSRIADRRIIQKPLPGIVAVSILIVVESCRSFVHLVHTGIHMNLLFLGQTRSQRPRLRIRLCLRKNLDDWVSIIARLVMHAAIVYLLIALMTARGDR